MVDEEVDLDRVADKAQRREKMVMMKNKEREMLYGREVAMSMRMNEQKRCEYELCSLLFVYFCFCDPSLFPLQVDVICGPPLH